jgi:hypothetical protein
LNFSSFDFFQQFLPTNVDLRLLKTITPFGHNPKSSRASPVYFLLKCLIRFLVVLKFRPITAIVLLEQSKFTQRRKFAASLGFDEQTLITGNSTLEFGQCEFVISFEP